jgi:integrase
MQKAIQRKKVKSKESTDKPVLKLEGPAFENFVDVIKSAETRETYIYRLRQYLTYRKFHSLNQMLKGKPARIQKDVIDYLKFLKNERQLSYATRQVVTAMFRKFYAQNDIVLNFDKIHNYLGEHEKTIEDRAYTREEILKLLEVSGLRAKVLILLLASSGLRRGAVPGIKRRHLKWIPDWKLYQITTYPKAKQKYLTFCTPEAAKEINAYFAFREQCGEVFNDETPLLREEFDVDVEQQVKNPKPASNAALKMLMVRIARLAGVRTPHQNGDNGKPTQRTEVMLTHGLRKFFDSNLVRGALHPVQLSALMGHRSGLQATYNKPMDEELLAEYVKSIDFLTISEENKLRIQVKALEDEKDQKLREMDLELAKEREARKAFEQHVIDIIREQGNKGQGHPVLNPEEEQ